MLENPLSSLMTWLVIGIALALPGILYVMLNNIADVSADWGGKPRVSLYLQKEVTKDVADALAKEIRVSVSVDEVRFVSSEAALKDFQQRSGFGDVLNSLDRNPLPHVIEVVLVSSEPMALTGLMAGWESDNRIAKVSVDLAWLERLFALLQFGERLVWSLSLVLALGVVLIMGNTIRLAIENRRQEIEVIKLFGATDSFVRRPFLYLGFWYGFGGATIAMILLQSSLVFLAEPVELLAQSYRDDFALQGPDAGGVLFLLLMGSLLGIAGALVAVSRHLRLIEPR
tara:strand:- start:329 stop:1183 length:855 start_codon:yes stop_codon:yes gene_type:complete